MALYAVATDSFMSGWGAAPRRSLVAVECQTEVELDFALAKLRDRPEMKRVRVVAELPRIASGDHLSVWRRDTHPAWFPAA